MNSLTRPTVTGPRCALGALMAVYAVAIGSAAALAPDTATAVTDRPYTCSTPPPSEAPYSGCQVGAVPNRP